MDLQIRLMQSEDAAGVVELYRTVYGDAYPVKSVYDPVAIMAAQDAGDCYRIVAVDEGRVLGHIASYRSAPPNPRLYEDGQGMVLPECRNRNILEDIWCYCHEVVHPEKGITLRWGEGVCNHVFTQKASLKLGYIYTGIEIDLMPAAAYRKEKSSAGRVSSILGFKVTDDVTRTIHVPAVYSGIVSFLYQPLPLRRRIETGAAPLPADRDTVSREEMYAEAAVARTTFMTLGRDFEARLTAMEEKALAAGCTVFQAFLNLSEPATVSALDLLRDHHYFLGGVLPRWYDDDGILMQKILHEPNIQGIKLESEGSWRILDLLLKDRESVLEG